MKSPGNRRAGQPIAVFIALLFCWGGLRATIWESPFPNPVSTTIIDTVADSAPLSGTLGDPALLTLPNEGTATSSNVPNWLISRSQTTLNGMAPIPLLGAVALEPNRPGVGGSAQFGLMAALGQMPVPQTLAQQVLPASKQLQPSISEPAAQPTNRVKRWSADGWVFLRPSTNSVSTTGGSQFPSYGASQAGAVLRFRLRPGSKARPTAYARATTALAGARDSELAAGLSVRPIPTLPVAAYAELRLTRNATTLEPRPAAFLVTEIPPLELPLGLRAETYLAAGYVGGDFATPFVDGQARIDREVSRVDIAPSALGSLRAGLGAWGGAQEGAARVDVGPSASVNVEVGALPARLSLDYRRRVAGDAEPGSGVALTLSTGF